MKLQNDETKFRIINESYDAMKVNLFKVLKHGDQANIKCKKSALKRANKHSILNDIASLLLTWWYEPNIIELEINGSTYITLSNYNKSKEESNYTNLIGGGIFVLFILTWLIRETLK